MMYLHTRLPPIIHRDLKSQNIFITEPSPNHFIAKIGDWGSARAIALSGAKSMTHGVGTACWLAPEVINYAHFSKDSDVYAFGIVLWEVFTRQEVYEGYSAAQIISKVAHEGLRPRIQPGSPCAALMTECWSQQPSGRPGFHRILKELSKMYAAAKTKSKSDTKSEGGWSDGYHTFETSNTVDSEKFSDGITIENLEIHNREESAKRASIYSAKRSRNKEQYYSLDSSAYFNTLMKQNSSPHPTNQPIIRPSTSLEINKDIKIVIPFSKGHDKGLIDKSNILLQDLDRLKKTKESYEKEEYLKVPVKPLTRSMSDPVDHKHRKRRRHSAIVMRGVAIQQNNVFGVVSSNSVPSSITVANNPKSGPVSNAESSNALNIENTKSETNEESMTNVENTRNIKNQSMSYMRWTNDAFGPRSAPPSRAPLLLALVASSHVCATLSPLLQADGHDVQELLNDSLVLANLRTAGRVGPGRARPIDLVLLDLDHPDAGGLACIRRLRDRADAADRQRLSSVGIGYPRRLTIVAITLPRKLTLKLREDVAAAGGDGVLPFPFLPETLRRLLVELPTNRYSLLPPGASGPSQISLERSVENRIESDENNTQSSTEITPKLSSTIYLPQSSIYNTADQFVEEIDSDNLWRSDEIKNDVSAVTTEVSNLTSKEKKKASFVDDLS
jgi:serine/threonine protein kinase